MTTLTVVLTGAESTGKTTLAAELAAALDAPWVPEYARAYLKTGSDYEQRDVLAIARGQHEAEEKALAAAPPVLVVDTDLLVLRIWSEVRFGRVDPWITERLAARLAGRLAERHAEKLTETGAQPQRLYLLTQPDIPWQPDPLRESPHTRDWLHARYRTALEDMAADFVEIRGARHERLATALEQIRARLIP